MVCHVQAECSADTEAVPLPANRCFDVFDALFDKFAEMLANPNVENSIAECNGIGVTIKDIVERYRLLPSTANLFIRRRAIPDDTKCLDDAATIGFGKRSKTLVWHDKKLDYFFGKARLQTDLRFVVMNFPLDLERH